MNCQSDPTNNHVSSYGRFIAGMSPEGTVGNYDYDALVFCTGTFRHSKLVVYEARPHDSDSALQTVLHWLLNGQVFDIMCHIYNIFIYTFTPTICSDCV